MPSSSSIPKENSRKYSAIIKKYEAELKKKINTLEDRAKQAKASGEISDEDYNNFLAELNTHQKEQIQRLKNLFSEEQLTKTSLQEIAHNLNDIIITEYEFHDNYEPCFEDQINGRVELLKKSAALNEPLKYIMKINAFFQKSFDISSLGALLEIEKEVFNNYIEQSNPHKSDISFKDETAATMPPFEVVTLTVFMTNRPTDGPEVEPAAAPPA